MDVRHDRSARHRRRGRHDLQPRLESLEDRKLLYATLGGQWTYGSRITYSFTPDGTDIAGSSSALFGTMNLQGISQATWQKAFQDAAATWEAVANINLVQVSDDGTTFGASGNQQSDPRFGDIRIGAIPLSSGNLALAFEPPPMNGGTLAGDIVFNSNATWGSQGYDIETVAIHEFGHALGMDHSTLSNADMYAYYNGTKTTSSSDDIAGIQSIYGARPGDAFDQAQSNNSYSNATDLTGYLSNGQTSIPNLDISTSSDTDWYKIVVPRDTNGTMTVTLQSTGLSSLSPHLYIHSSSLSILGSATAAFSYGATVSLTLNNVAPNQFYYIRAVPANGGPSSVGAYGLQVNFVGGTMAPIAPPVTTVAQQPDGSGGSMGLNADSSPGNAPGRGRGPVNPEDASTIGPNLIQIGNIVAPGDYLTVAPGWNPGASEFIPIDLTANVHEGVDVAVPLVLPDDSAPSGLKTKPRG